MTYSAKLQRHISVPIEQLNNFDQAELDAAVSALPGYPDTPASEIVRMALAGNLNAMLIVEMAQAGDEGAKSQIIT